MSVATSTSPTYDHPRPSSEASLHLEAWYHGMITRIRAEALVQAEGDFLVRDSISSPGDYVLTVFWKGRAIHFQINKIPSRKSTTSVFFQFEDEQFESVSDLISFCQTHRKPVTITSGCIIKNPVPNIASLKKFDSATDIEQNYMKLCRLTPTKPAFDRCLSQQVLLNETRKLCMKRQTSLSTCNLNGGNSDENASKKEHFTLSSLLSRPLPIPERLPIEDDQDEYCEMDYDSMEENPPNINDAAVGSLVRCPQHTSLTSLNSAKLSPSLSMTQSCYDVSKLNWRLPRTDSAPSLPERKTGSSVRDSGFVTDTSDYDHPLSYQKPGPSEVIDTQNHYCTFREERKTDFAEYVQKLRNLMNEKGPSYCALLIMQEDCRLLRFFNTPKTGNKSKINGLELILLPQGAAIREELIERARSLQFLCVLSILTVSKVFRSKLLSQWITIAQQLLHNYGDLFSFLTIISALSSKAMLKSTTIWKMVEKTAYDEFRSNLTPLAECLRKRGEIPSELSDNVSVPVLQPILDLLSKTPSSFFLDTTTVSAQIESLWKWLEMGRLWSLESEIYQKRATVKCLPNVLPTENLLAVEYYERYLFCNDRQLLLAKDPKQKYEKLLQQIDSLAKNL